MRLALYPKELERVTGLDLVILEPGATVQDLADAFQPFAGCEGGIFKRTLKGSGPCRACLNSCCTTSIIAPDPISFDATARGLGLSEAVLLSQRCDPTALAEGVVRLHSYPCTFLGEDGTCTMYDHRSLICRFFICCPYSPGLEDLVHNILGAGLAALVRGLQAQGLVPPTAPSGYTAPALHQAMAAYEEEFNRFYRSWVLRDVDSNETMPPAWYENPFDSARSYGEIPLHPFATAEQWQRLTRGSIAHPA